MLPQSLADLIARRKSLTLPQLAALVQQLKEFAASQGVGPFVQNDPASFAEKWSNGNWLRAKHLEVLNEHLVSLESGQSDLPRLIVNMPPRHGKSEFISFWFPIWLLAKNPKRKILLISYEAEFAASWGRRIRDWIRDYGPELGLILDSSSTAAHRWALTTGGTMTTAGAGGPITGKGADVIILDDPIKNDEEAASEILREKLWTWHQATAMTRLEPGAFIVALGTRWHEDDLLGRLERYGTPNKDGETQGLKYEILKLKAIAETNDPLGRKEGEALWSFRYPIDKLMEIRKGMSPYLWSALYQQNPTPEEGNAVKRSWWQWYKETPPKFDIMIQSWDTAFEDMKKSDYCVGQVWGRVGASFYLIDQIRERMNARDVIKVIKDFHKKYPKAIGKIIERAANGPAIIQVLQKEVPGLIPVVPKGSKDARLQSVIPYIEAGNVFLPIPDKCPWIMDFVEECAVFPRGTHDDQLDAMVHALRHLQPQAWAFADKESRREREEAEAPKTIQEVHNREVHSVLKKAVKKSERDINSRTRMFR